MAGRITGSDVLLEGAQRLAVMQVATAKESLTARATGDMDCGPEEARHDTAAAFNSRS